MSLLRNPFPNREMGTRWGYRGAAQDTYGDEPQTPRESRPRERRYAASEWPAYLGAVEPWSDGVPERRRSKTPWIVAAGVALATVVGGYAAMHH